MNIGGLENILSPDFQMLLLAIAMAFTFSLAIVSIALPGLIRKMREGGMEGRDVNKNGNVRVPELGGIAALFAFSISLSIIVGIQKLIGDLDELPYLALISVFFIAAMVGLIDDISNISQRLKAVAVGFAALPLLLIAGWVQTHIGDSMRLPFGHLIAFPSGSWTYFLYWLLLVPLSVTGVENGMNMSAGYNGLESGQIAIVSSSILAVLVLRDGQDPSAMIAAAALVGAALGLYAYNRYPARVFVGDIGTLGMGAALAGTIIVGHIELIGLVAIAPAFYEAGATAYYSLVKKVPDRRHACHNPVIGPDGILKPPRGAERYTLAYYLLSKRSMTEKQLVRFLLMLYALSGAAAVVLSVL